jgi:hypothetical protein
VYAYRAVKQDFIPPDSLIMLMREFTGMLNLFVHAMIEKNLTSRNSVSMQSHYMIKHSGRGSEGLNRSFRGMPVESVKQSKDVEQMAGSQISTIFFTKSIFSPNYRCQYG